MDKRLKDLGPFIRLVMGHWRRIGLGMLMGIAAAAAGVGLLSLAGWFLSAAALAGFSALSAAMFNFFYPSIGVRIFAFCRTLSRYAERVISHDATFRILQSLRVWLYSRLEPHCPALISKFHSGDVLGRMVEDVDTLDHLYLRVISPSVIALATTALVSVFLGFFDAVIAITGCAGLALAGVMVSIFTARLGAAAGEHMARRRSALRAHIIDGLSGIEELLVYGAAEKQQQIIGNSSGTLSALRRRMTHITGLASGLITLTAGLSVLAVLYLSIEGVSAGSFHPAAVALVVFAVLAAFESVWPLPAAFQYFGRTRESAKRLKEIADAPPMVLFPDHTPSAPGGFDIAFTHVRFRYPSASRWIFEDLDCHIANGRRVAVIGETGSGKSTLVHLLARFWDPDGGRISIGGKPLASFAEPDLRRWMSVVSQNPYIFSASLKDNLLVARPDGSEAALAAALENAHLADFVDTLPEGPDTWIGENGRLLSGGQAKRLTLARAFLHNAPLWILDEPTEGLDRSTAHSVMQNVFRKTAGKTVIIVTHRMRDMALMDQIILMKNGRIHAQGDHPALLEGCSEYANLCRHCEAL